MGTPVIAEHDLDGYGNGTVLIVEDLGSAQQTMARLVFKASDAMVGVMVDPFKEDSPVIFVIPAACMVTLGELPGNVVLRCHTGEVTAQAPGQSGGMVIQREPCRFLAGKSLQLLVNEGPVVLEWQWDESTEG